ncbi:MAG: peptidase S10 [Cyanobacteria bacterium QS_8_64_29]|nr:MAG: peptidase S10 [Cyanobacteria bacterium QS_8_64_29]
MADSAPAEASDRAYQPPAGRVSEYQFSGDGSAGWPYQVRAEWLPLRERERAVAEVFHVAYLAGDAHPGERPLTFAFNGGPGASSAFLHLGALGPQRVAFAADGTAPPPPVQLESNPASWLPWTDLVFVDPVGTGFSRPLEAASDTSAPSQQNRSDTAQRDSQAETGNFYALQRDLDALAEFLQRFLSRHGRWESPIFVVGESYGGFRVAKLTQLLQQRYGIGLNGAILLSPALEFQILDPSDYDLLPWIDTFPTMAATAAFHGASRTWAPDAAPETVRAEAARFASNDLPRLLVQGAAMPDEERQALLQTMADMLGLPEALVTAAQGRIAKTTFVRHLLRDHRRVCGLYDATVTAVDPYPDRERYEGPDPTLAGIDRIFEAGINALLRRELGLETERPYTLVNWEANRCWQVDLERHLLERQIGATDELRYGLQLNPHLQVYLAHGYYDLVTPFHTSDRLVQLMKLDEGAAARLAVERFGGGHMFYTWPASRSALATTMQAFYARAI